ncbi:MAG: hypothetical protein RRA92_11220 [Gemmatimonadota bacterium]|nr:hypothetical protein [Gemmatimonadota bacterium]
MFEHLDARKDELQALLLRARDLEAEADGYMHLALKRQEEANRLKKKVHQIMHGTEEPKPFRSTRN